MKLHEDSWSFMKPDTLYYVSMYIISNLCKIHETSLMNLSWTGRKEFFAMYHISIDYSACILSTLHLYLHCQWLYFVDMQLWKPTIEMHQKTIHTYHADLSTQILIDHSTYYVSTLVYTASDCIM